MRKLSINQNARAALVAKPPTVVFMVCLFTFLVVLCSFMIYIKTHDVRNPDELDWNVFREKMASLDYCVKYPSQENKFGSDSHDKNLKSLTTKLDQRNSYFYDLTFDIDYWGSLEELKNLKELEGKIDGFFIGKEKEILDIKFQINNIQKNPTNSCDKRIIVDKECHEYLISGCISLTASTRIFPKTQAPETCSFRKHDVLLANQTAEFIVYKETPELPYHYWCPATFGAKSIIKNTKDPNLSLFLTEADKSIISSNLGYLIIILGIHIMICIIYIVLRIRKTIASVPHAYSQMAEM